MRQTDAGFGNQDLRALGHRLRHLREQRQWSLKRLAQEGGISVAAIRKIELGQSNPSILTILALVEALGESIDRLISAAREGEVRITVTRGNARLDRPTDNDDRTRNLADPAMRCSVVTLRAGRGLKDTGRREMAFVYILDGAVSVADADPCNDGDAFHVSSLSRFRLKNAGGKQARLLLVTGLAKNEPDTGSKADQND